MFKPVLNRILDMVFFILLSCNSYAQLQPFKPTIVSPNTASLGAFGDIPVSYFTGVPGISVPVYEIKTKTINIPISLDYHAAGVRPDQHPGWVGSGWNISAGGAISRSIKKLPDESKSQGVNIGYYYNGSLITGTNWESYAKADGITDATNKRVFHNSLNLTDLEPDEFNFSFLGNSGKFYYDPGTASFVVKSDAYFKVYLDPNEQFTDPFMVSIYADAPGFTKAFGKFIIEDNKGNKFIFGGSGATEFSEPMNYGARGSQFWATSWQLIQIIPSNSQETIDFEYERGPFVSQLYKYANTTAVTTSTPGCQASSFSNWQVQGTFISPVYLKRIKVANGVAVDFTINKSNELTYKSTDYGLVFPTATTDDFALLNNVNDIPYLLAYTGSLQREQRLIWLKLNDLKVSDDQGNKLLAVQFNYNENSNERLFLDKLVFQSSDTLSNYNYSFSYHNRENLPKYLENITDHWGYFNGQVFGNYNPATFALQRQVDTVLTKTGVLDQITYPTGGFTRFDYENNDYSSKVDNKNRLQVDALSGIAGGLRIKRVTSYSAPGMMALQKEYSYKKNYINGGTASSGVLNSMPQYNYGPFSAQDMSGAAFTYYMYTSSPVVPLTEEGGVQTGYSEVTETQQDAAGKVQYSTFTYTNHDNGYKDSPANSLYNRTNAPFDAYNSRLHERGRILTTLLYNSDKKLVKSTQNTWSRFLESSSPAVHSLLFNFMDVALNCNTLRYYPSSVSYLNYTYPFVLSDKTETDFMDGSNSVAHQTTFAYTNKLSLRSEAYKDSKGDSVKTVYRYPGDLFSEDPSNVYHEMDNLSMVSAVVDKSVYLNASRTDYSSTDYFKPFTGIYVPQTGYTAKGNHTKEVRYVYNAYDDKGNPLSISKKDGAKINYIWGYYSKYPIAEVNNAEYATIQTVLGDANLTALKNEINPVTINTLLAPLRTDSRLKDAQVTTYTYQPSVGMISQTDSRGLATTYEYDTFQRLAVIKNHDGDIIKTLNYNYKTPLPVFKNDAKSQSFNASCPNGSAVVYTVPAGKYSAGSKDAANLLAQNDIDANGQTYANANGNCPVYARVEMVNGTSTISYGGLDGTDVTTVDRSDIYVRFYSDVNCTVPVNVKAGYQVNVNTASTFSNKSGSQTTNAAIVLSTSTITNQIAMGNFIVHNQTNFDDHDPNGVFYENFSWAYKVLSLTGASYTALPTVYP